MKFTEGAFKNWGYELAEKEFGDKVFTWRQYDRIKDEKGTEAANEAQKMQKQLAKSSLKMQLLISSCNKSLLVRKSLM